MVIGERLKQIREEKQLSQGDIQKKTGLLRCYLSRIENQHTIPSIETLEKWTGALGVSMAQLFATNGEEPKPLVLKSESGKDGKKLSRTTTNNLRQIEGAFIKLNPKDQAVAVGFIRRFASR